MKFAERLLLYIYIIFCFIYFTQTFSFSPDWRGYPQVLLAILFILCVFFLLIDVFYPKSNEHYESNIIFSRVIFVAVLTLIYILMLNIVGFYLATVVFSPILMYFLGIKDIRLLIRINIFFIIVLYIGFSIFLGVPTPQGILF